MKQTNRQEISDFIALNSKYAKIETRQDGDNTFKYISVDRGYLTYTATICFNQVSGKYAGMIKETKKEINQREYKPAKSLYNMGAYELEQFYKGQRQNKREHLKQLYTLN